ncbi:hypothetical protein [Pseudosulfitobacter sp. DSM 107133]|jgi:hypothetical protein|uniref:hypothetical protein n=1 Tax=Pseudosulfitobacter sp. DSM 107133 TaxID=2883100 RepID=UPI000DF3DF5B|nr:hypothetical protein [Pseudosulfitobacter sp. DSM 107133]UOA27529.1 hypothetical protein DSM107133_02257 [Pseudosulfitobacter sp. DSM 107133]
MKLISALLPILLAACSPQYVETTVSNPQDLPVRRALFAQDPTGLHEAFRAACDSPGDILATPARGIVQCRTLPTPDFAAFLLLEYDGALKTPTVVMQKQQRRTDAGPQSTLVEFSYFAEVPQKSGTPRRIYYKDRQLDHLLDQMMRAAGGKTVD